MSLRLRAMISSSQFTLQGVGVGRQVIGVSQKRLQFRHDATHTRYCSRWKGNGNAPAGKYGDAAGWAISGTNGSSRADDPSHRHSRTRPPKVGAMTILPWRGSDTLPFCRSHRSAHAEVIFRHNTRDYGQRNMRFAARNEILRGDRTGLERISAPHAA